MNKQVIREPLELTGQEPGWDNLTANRELIDQLTHEFIKQCNYNKTQKLENALARVTPEAAQTCKEMKVDPATYIAAQLTYAPILNGYRSLTPAQLIAKDAKAYVTDFISLKGDRHIEREFEMECRMLSQCIENGWPERLALLNSTLDFSPWFRILIASEWDEELVTQYGRLALQVLNHDKELLVFLKTVKSVDGKGLDFKRIPNFKYE